MTPRLVRQALLLATILSPASVSIHAQADAVRTLSGTVTGDDGKPIPGAVVKLQTDSTKAILSFITEPNGTYVFKRLSSNGDYTVWATWKGVRSKQKSLDHFNTQPDPKIDLNVNTH